MKVFLLSVAVVVVGMPSALFAVTASVAPASDLTVEQVQKMVDEPAVQSAEGVETELVPEVQGEFEGKVTRILDAGTIEINGIRMHLAGLNVPLQTHWGMPIDCYSDASTKFLTEMVKDQPITYSYDRLLGRRDPYGIRFVYLYVDGKLVNAEMLLQGKAFADRARKYWKRDFFLEAEAQGRLRNLGLWHTCVTECTTSGCRTKNW